MVGFGGQREECALRKTSLVKWVWTAPYRVMGSGGQNEERGYSWAKTEDEKAKAF